MSVQFSFFCLEYICVLGLQNFWSGKFCMRLIKSHFITWPLNFGPNDQLGPKFLTNIHYYLKSGDGILMRFARAI